MVNQVRTATKVKMAHLVRKASREAKGPWDLLDLLVSEDLQVTKELLDPLVTKALEVKWAGKEQKERMDQLA